ncbi:MAG: histidinol dehydrogenase, partial [Ghiorsea sp.]|nr:histidinol dehydrogenase [Ghiorsea sp.]
MSKIQRIYSTSADYRLQMDALLSRETDTGADVQNLVADILSDVKTRGNAALCEYTAKFDGWDCTVENMVISREAMEKAWFSVSDMDRQSLQLAADRIRVYHEKQVQDDWSYTDSAGLTLGQRSTALDSVGIYVPGGKAAYPSSVLMSAVPAQVAGVGKIIMVVPTPAGEMND